MDKEDLGLTRPRLDPEDARKIAKDLFGLEATGAIEELPSERDQNFLLAPHHVLKIARASEAPDVIDLQCQALAHVAKHDPELPVPRLRPGLSGNTVLESPQGYLCRVVDYLPGIPLARYSPRTGELLLRLGRFLGRLDRALEGFSHGAQGRELKWDFRRAGAAIADGVALVAAGERRSLLERQLERVEGDVLPRLQELPLGVIHNDANDHNLLIGIDGSITGILDFGDMIEGAFVCDLAILLAYTMLDESEPVSAAADVVAGYHAERPLSEEEVALLFPLAVTRLAMSVSISARQFRDEPDQDYLRVSEAPAWRLLEGLQAQPAVERRAHYTFRAACGMAPVPGAESARLFFESQEPAPVLPFPLASEPIHVFDLSAGSLELAGLDVIESVERFEAHLSRRMKESGARVGIGRYDEARPIYTSAAFLPEPGERAEPRTLHLGVDLFVEAGTRVHAPIRGVVHSFRFNDHPLDYGPTIILEHEAGYTLYGHLSLASLEGLETGQVIERGEVFAEVGSYPTNGNWPPHLHFQIVLDLLGAEGDFPGVARASERDLWLGLCPDPSRLLGLTPRPVPKLELAPRRHDHLSRTLSVAYEQPLQIVRGYGAFLYDDRARPYLDMVNNVCHVGHCHPRVVRAAAEQAAVLNTNTRYLHPNIIDYAERLTATLPEPLEVCFFVNSGSEANDLALRLARAHTGKRETFVLEGAYHGNLTSLIEVSPYKFDGKGGRGAPPHVTKLPMPDGYRGRFRASEEGYAERYLEDARERLDRGPVGALIAESIMSCGGQIVLPPGYLAGLHRLVRERGGVVIADEVQVGFGRVGSHFWAFEAEGVVPDIVTMGKPIGNGHPLGCVVTTREVARSFETGMEYFNTFGGNPVSCAVGLAVLNVIEEEKLRENAARMGETLLSGLRALAKEHPLIGDVRGRGLFLGFELVRDRVSLQPAASEARYLVNRMKDEGILTSTDGPLENVIKLKPPLVFSEANARSFLGRLASVLTESRLNP